MAQLALGIDFGSLSGRAVLVDVASGAMVASVVHEYEHGFIEDRLPATGEKLPPDWTLQDPQDYLAVLAEAIPAVLREAGAAASDVIGVGIDFTSCTVMPITCDGTPLCLLPAYRANKHAWVKVWKHHAAQQEANRLNTIAAERNEAFLSRYGGKISSEWLFPKLWQILNEAPDIYEAMDRFIEATDWIVLQLTGQERRSSCAAGYKALWSKQQGYPSNEFFRSLDPRLERVVDDKLSRSIWPIGSKAGEITPQAARLTGLLPGTAVAVGTVDAHVAVPSVGITAASQMLMIMGTSTCHMLLGHMEIIVPGICGVVEDGVLPGFFAYEAGQSCVGDHFDWFIRNCVPPACHQEAVERNVSIHSVLREKTMRQKPGASGLLALDWWNGNRSVLVDGDLTGLILGMTLATKPEEIYRALIEATAYGTRMIMENFVSHGLQIEELFACGGIAAKDPFMMQIYADVTGREIRVSASPQTVAIGSALFGAVAAGKARGGFDSIFAAAKIIPRLKDVIYRPIADNVAIYDKIYAEYLLLHDTFGRGGNDVMKRLKAIRLEAHTP
ncbi:MAG: ribulokinase [Bacillota bacterium]|nr:ribulokinase [Bacillota bacterium]